MSDARSLTIGDVLPASMRSKYSAAVLALSLKEARDIVKFDMPPTSNLTADDVAALKEIYKEYQTHNAYWNKKEADNEAYWSSQGS